MHEDGEQLERGLVELTKAGIVSAELGERLTSIHKTIFKKIPDSPLPLYSATSGEKPSKIKKTNNCFVPIEHDGKERYIHKVTAIWLLQEGELVSSDRLFRVRQKQPHSNEPQQTIKSETACNNTPTVESTITIGDMCVFAKDYKTDNACNWQLGRHYWAILSELSMNYLITLSDNHISS